MFGLLRQQLSPHGALGSIASGVTRDESQPGTAFGIHAKEREGHITAQRMPGDHRALDLQRVEQCGEVAGKHFHQRRTVTALRLPAAPQIRPDDPLPGQRGDDGIPDGSVAAEPVHEHQREARAPGVIVADRTAVERNPHARRYSGRRASPASELVSRGIQE